MAAANVATKDRLSLESSTNVTLSDHLGTR
jgi:hypothetical protein